MDMAPIILILTPVLLPVTQSLGIDPVHFGMIMMVNLGIGLITPPVGSVLFVASAVSKQKIEHGARDATVLRHALLVLGMITYIPAISLAAGIVRHGSKGLPLCGSNTGTAALRSAVPQFMLHKGTKTGGYRGVPDRQR